MKKILLQLTFVFLISSVLNSQSLSFTYEGEPIPNNSEIYVVGDASLGKIIAPISITNNAFDSLDIKVKKIEIDTLPGSSNSFCFGGICNGSIVYETSYSVKIAPGETDDSFEGDYFPNQNIGQTIIAYVFFDMNNPSDSAIVTVIYNGIITSTDEVSYTETQVSEPYPNPAGESISFNTSLPDFINDLNLFIYNLSGSAEKELKLNNTGDLLKVNITDLKDGFYFYSLKFNNIKIKSGRFLVRH